MGNSKPYKTPKQTVYIAHKKVKANKGSAGINGMHFEKCEEDATGNLYKLWNRTSSGSYFPKAVKAVGIPKTNRGTRRLRILTIDNRIAQMTAKPIGVISPILANLFMHYAFDLWMTRNHRNSSFERYADDTVVHCRTEWEAKQLSADIDTRLKECGLELHPTKTKIVYC